MEISNSDYVSLLATIDDLKRDNEQLRRELNNFKSRLETFTPFGRDPTFDNLLNTDNVNVKLIAAKSHYGMEMLIKDNDCRVREAVAREGYGLDTLIYDIDENVRAEVARHAVGLDVLINDVSPIVRCAVAENCYGLDILVSDNDPDVRFAVAQYGERKHKEQLINDDTSAIRKLLASDGYGLHTLINDDDIDVRFIAESKLNSIIDNIIELFTTSREEVKQPKYPVNFDDTISINILQNNHCSNDKYVIDISYTNSGSWIAETIPLTKDKLKNILIDIWDAEGNLDKITSLDTISLSCELKYNVKGFQDNDRTNLSKEYITEYWNNVPDIAKDYSSNGLYVTITNVINGHEINLDPDVLKENEIFPISDRDLTYKYTINIYNNDSNTIFLEAETRNSWEEASQFAIKFLKQGYNAELIDNDIENSISITSQEYKKDGFDILPQDFYICQIVDKSDNLEREQSFTCELGDSMMLSITKDSYFRNKDLQIQDDVFEANDFANAFNLVNIYVTDKSGNWITDYYNIHVLDLFYTLRELEATKGDITKIKEINKYGEVNNLNTSSEEKKICKNKNEKDLD